MLFRWVVQDVVLPFVKLWRMRGWGIGLGHNPQRLCHLLWGADDMWPLAHEVWQLESMYRELPGRLLLRPEKSKLAVFGPTPEVIVPSGELAAIERVSDDACLRPLADHVQVDGGSGPARFGLEGLHLRTFVGVVELQTLHSRAGVCVCVVVRSEPPMVAVGAHVLAGHSFGDVTAALRLWRRDDETWR